MTWSAEGCRSRCGALKSQPHTLPTLNTLNLSLCTPLQPPTASNRVSSAASASPCHPLSATATLWSVVIFTDC